jgi:N-acetylmuramoyl-L-alanine amidase
MNNPIYLIVHHSGGTDQNPLQDSSNYTVEMCDADHKVRFNMLSRLGHYCGYHYFIDKSGIITQTRMDDEEGAHTIGHNLESLGICLAGNFDATLPTDAQIKTLSKLLTDKVAKFNIPLGNIIPHRHFAQKSCYGNKLADNWASLLVMTKEVRLAKAAALLKEAMQLLDGII